MRLTCLCCFSMVLSACATTTPSQPVPVSTANVTAKPLLESWGYPLEAIDRTARPQDDFYQFANGHWLAETDIPSDRSSTGFNVTMSERNEARIAEIIVELSKTDLPSGSNGQKIRDLYNDFMDKDAIEAKGMAPIAADLSRIRAAQTHEDIVRLMADPSLDLGGPFAIYVMIDPKSPTDYVMGMNHSGLSLPDRSYYLRDSEQLTAIRTAYKLHLGHTLERLGETVAEKRADELLALETAIARLHWTRAERRDANANYNRMTIAELKAMAPGFPWEVGLETMGLPPNGQVVIREKSAFAPLAQLFVDTPVSVWQDYLLLKLISHNAAYLPDEVYLADFDFYGITLQGQQEPRDREKRGIALVNDRLEHAVGRAYIDRFFPNKSKILMEDMFENIRTALRMRIDHLDWMSEATKSRAQEKLEQMTAKIAYPNEWKDYADLRIIPGDLYGNIKRHRAWSTADNVNRLGTKVNKEEWFTAPQTVNAFYSPQRNEVFIPAGYIQSPLFDPNADPAINYGAIGSIIGHEIGHGFDDQGSKYDAHGKLDSWWTDEDRAAFERLGDRFAEQFDQYEPLPGLRVNGRQTLGENIGDLAGMIVTYHAYILSLQGEEPPILDGFTGPQRVFLGRAQARRLKRTNESQQRQLLSGTHSPMKLRVNGIIRNMDEFYDAFDVQPGDGMYLPPEERVRIW